MVEQNKTKQNKTIDSCPYHSVTHEYSHHEVFSSFLFSSIYYFSLLQAVYPSVFIIISEDRVSRIRCCLRLIFHRSTIYHDWYCLLDISPLLLLSLLLSLLLVLAIIIFIILLLSSVLPHLLFLSLLLLYSFFYNYHHHYYLTLNWHIASQSNNSLIRNIMFSIDLFYYPFCSDADAEF